MSISNLNSDYNFASLSKFKFFKYMTICIALLFILRLAHLQLVEGNVYKSVSEAQAIKPFRIEPFRGNIFDRNNILFVHNSPSFSLQITPKDFNILSIPILTSILGLDSITIATKVSKNKAINPFVPVRIIRDLSFEKLSLIEEYIDYLPGVEVIVESKRLYDYEGNFSHLLGYTREISSEELRVKQYYKSGDIIGKTGLEDSYEIFLRGREGLNFVAKNKYGEVVAKFDNGKRDIPSNNGFDLKLGLDLKLQQIAEASLGDNRGSIVAINPQNGEIMVFLSKPDYDPRKFTGRVPFDYYSEMVNDPGKPLLHRTIQSAYPPGSAWKMMVACAALEEGIIDERTTFTCTGGLPYGDRVFKCMHTHGTINVVRAIQGSCNVFFYNCGIKLGIERLIKWGRIFGFGQKTGIDIPNEKQGNYPELDVLKKRYKGYIPGGMALNFGIGQGDILVTPLQMAVYNATLSSRGKWNQPHLVRSVFNNIYRKDEPLNYKTKDLPISQKTFDIVLRGMYDVVMTPGGTASRAKIPGIEVAGKTSTAQNPHGKPHAWFVCFAPYNKPTIAITVMIENIGSGGANAAPLARNIMEGYFYPERCDSLLQLLKKKPTIESENSLDSLIPIAIN